jgi:hypothetical protein
VRRAAELLKAAHLSAREISRRTRKSEPTISAGLRCHQSGRKDLLPTDAVVELLDQHLHANGELIGLWKAAVIEHTIHDLNVPFSALDGLLPEGWRTVDRTGEVRPTDRRLFNVGGLSAAAVLAFAGEVDEQLQAHRPRITEVADAETALADLERDRDAADPADLFPPAYEAWSTVEKILSRRVHPAYVPKLTLLAGTLAAGLSTVASFAGHERFGRVFAGIAEVHANAAGEPALQARVAGIQSWQALDAGLALNAADIAARGRRIADPADRARLAAYEAEAAAAAGLYGRAEEAVAAMREGARAAAAGTPAIAWGEANEHLFVALTAAQIPGRAADAVASGEIAAAGFERPCQGMALAHLAVASGRLRGSQPDPAAAAAATIAALDVVSAAPNAEVHDRARRLAAEMVPWQRESLVAELSRRVAAV